MNPNSTFPCAQAKKDWDNILMTYSKDRGQLIQQIRNWHKFYTSWLNDELIEKMIVDYQEQFDKIDAQNNIQTEVNSFQQFQQLEEKKKNN